MCPGYKANSNRWYSWDMNPGNPASKSCPPNHTLCQFSKVEEISQETCSVVLADMVQRPHLYPSLKSPLFTCSPDFLLNTS